MSDQEEVGILLAREPSQENDLRLAIFGETRGIFWITAKHARASKRRFGGRLQPFSRSRFFLARFRQTFVLDGVEVEAPRLQIPGDLARYYPACYLVEAARVALRAGSPQPVFFRLLDDLLRVLDEAQPAPHFLVRGRFERELLELLGSWPPAPPPLPQVTFGLDAQDWGDSPPGPRHLRVDPKAYEVFEALAGLPLDTALAHDPGVDALRDLYRLSAHLLRYHLDRPLKSEKLLNEFQGKAIAALEAASEVRSEEVGEAKPGSEAGDSIE